ncbi:MAG: glycosyltransferase family 2 protein [Prevotella sp.]|nr:glycosyltransferase family 2 protein [Prevotella sp.]
MSSWYDKYLSIYGRPFSEVPPQVVDATRRRLAQLQSSEPAVSLVVIAHNEETRLPACLWSLSHIVTRWPVELIGVNNRSTDHTEAVFTALGVTCLSEEQQGPGHARQCGLRHARGRYHFFLDADTLYPPRYVELMMRKLTQPGVAGVGALWSFYPDARHSRAALFAYELLRDIFLFVQHFKRPELCIRGMTFAFRADLAARVSLRTDIRRGEDGSLALELKRYGRIRFLCNRQARPVTGYGTLGQRSLWQSFIDHARIQAKGIGRIFYRTDHYADTPDNML